MNDKTLTANQNPPKFKALEHLKRQKQGIILFFKERYMLVWMII